MTRRTVLRCSLLAVAGVSALFALRYLDLNPVTLGGFPTEIEMAGSPPGRGGRADVIVWLDSAAILDSARERRFSRLDLSAAWISLLEGRLGSVGVWDGPIVEVDAPPRALVVTASVADRVDPSRVEAWIDGGATVLVDAGNDGIADHHWLERARIEVAGRIQPKSPDLSPLLDARLAAQCSALPFFAPPSWSRYVATDASGELVPGLEDPLLLERKIGAGRLLVAAAPLARWWCRLAQGEPNEDFTLRERNGDYEDLIEPDDLVLDPAQRSCETPFSDRLAEALIALLDPKDAPLPRVAWYPRGSKGVYLMTHDEDLRGGAEMVSLAAADAAAGIRGTHFVIGHPRLGEDWTRAHVAAIQEAGGALAIHWNRYPTPRGLLKIEPVQWVATLDDQLAWLAPFPRDARAWNRNHFLLVAGTWTSSFRAMEASGVAFDSTYAANKGRGYLFGSAMPRRIVDENGLPLKLREVAFQNQEDWGGADTAFFERLFTDNAESGRGVLVSIFHPPKVLRTPTPPATIEHACAVALATGHRSLTAPEYGRFVLANLELELDSRVDPSGGVVVAYANAAEGTAILHPVGPRGADVAPADFEFALETIGGRDYLRIELRPGSGEFRVAPK